MLAADYEMGKVVVPNSYTIFLLGKLFIKYEVGIWRFYRNEGLIILNTNIAIYGWQVNG